MIGMGLGAMLDILFLLAVGMMVLAVILYVVGKLMVAHAEREIERLQREGIESDPYLYHERP